MKYLALAVLLASAPPALAGEDFPFSSFRNELDTSALDVVPEVDLSADYNGTVDLVGGLNIALDLTPMSVVTSTFDVPPQTYQHLGYTTTWACFTDAGRRLWYFADQTYETRDDIYVGSIIDEPADPATDAMFGCKPDPTAMLGKQAALPLVGTTLSELAAFYKTTLPDDARYVSGYVDGGKASKFVYYRLTRGIVDAVSIAGNYLEADPGSDAHLNGMAEEVLASEWADTTTIDDYLFNAIAFDDPAVETSFLLDGTPLATVHSTFGGAAQTEEIFEGTPITWLCYDTGNARTTFVALRVQGEGNETIEPGPVLGIVIEELSAPASGACSESPAAASPLPGNDIPGLGASKADLEARFGTAPIDAGGHLAYIAHLELGDEESWTEHKTIYYRLENGVVTGVAYRLTTER